MTLQERAKAYSLAFPKFPPLRADHRWIDGMWLLGNNYRVKSGYYGGYPAGYLARVMALFPDINPKTCLHACAGKVDAPGVRVDLNPIVCPHIVADVTKLPFADGTFPLVLADPPYSPTDAERYGVPMVNRAAMMRELCRVTQSKGFIVWLDTVTPMFSKRQAQWVGAIGIQRSTNHRVRACNIFQVN